MQPTTHTRLLESPFVAGVAHSRFHNKVSTLAQPDGCWDIVFIRHAGKLFIVRTGLTTKPVTIHHRPGDEILSFSFKASVFMPAFSPRAMRDEGVDLIPAGNKHFWLGGDLYEIPTLETADSFVSKLNKKGALQSSDVVASLLAGRPKAMSERSMQRHFLNTTGLTYKTYAQIQRAQKAVQLLQTGLPAMHVAFALGYSDQSHLINSLKYIMGQTPRQISKIP